MVQLTHTVSVVRLSSLSGLPAPSRQTERRCSPSYRSFKCSHYVHTLMHIAQATACCLLYTHCVVVCVVAAQGLGYRMKSELAAEVDVAAKFYRCGKTLSVAVGWRGDCLRAGLCSRCRALETGVSGKPRLTQV